MSQYFSVSMKQPWVWLGLSSKTGIKMKFTATRNLTKPFFDDTILLQAKSMFREKPLDRPVVDFVLFCIFLGRLRLSRPISAGGPSMPKNVKAREYNDNSARITWDHSDDPVLLYAVGFINVDLRSNEKYAADDISPNADQYVVPGLQPNTRYMFFVRGINAKGSGVPSLLSNVIGTKSAGPTSKKSSS
jgi:hypothetical protein